MKKILLTGALLYTFAGFAQDTTCTFFTGDRVIEFDYKTSEIIAETSHNDRFYKLEVGYREVVCLDFNDYKSRVRKVITIKNGESFTNILDSKGDIYYSVIGPLTIFVGKPKRIILK